MRKIIFSIVLFLSVFGLFAQYPTDTVYLSIYPPEMGMPDYLHTVIDTSVPDPIEIVRITDHVQDWDWYPHHEYSKIQPWNADGTVYKFYSVAIYDNATHQMIRELPGSEIWPSYWSNTNPDLIYSFRENGEIKVYNINTDSISVLYHIYYNDSLQEEYDVVKLGPGEGNIDIYDHYVALVAKHDDDMDVIVFDLQNLNVVCKKTFSGAWGNSSSPQYVDWVSVSQSGSYVGIMWDNSLDSSNSFNGHYGVEIFNTTDLQFLRRIADYGNHGDFGFDAEGNEVFVQFWGETGTLNMYYLDTLKRVVLSNNPDFAGEGHISCRNYLRPGWAYVSQDEHTGQIVAVKLDTSGIVELFGHHFSTAETYLKSPMPCPNPTGTEVMFKSDFGDTTTDVIYTFVAHKNEITSAKNIISQKIQVFPNPADDLLTVTVDEPVKAINIYSVNGVKILSSGSTYVDISSLNDGIYFIEIITSSQKHFFGKIIKK